MHWSCCNIADFSNETLQQAYACLSSSRKEHIDRLRQREDKARSLAAEVLVQTILREHYAITGAALHRKPNGQPYLSGCDLHVSISHCNRTVACAVSPEPVGIDVEQIRPINLNICRHVCTEAEKAYVGTVGSECPGQVCRDPEILRRFFEIWTAKEAYFKKCGTGITDLKSVNILPLQRQIHFAEDYMVQIL